MLLENQFCLLDFFAGFAAGYILLFFHLLLPFRESAKKHHYFRNEFGENVTGTPHVWPGLFHPWDDEATKAELRKLGCPKYQLAGYYTGDLMVIIHYSVIGILSRNNVGVQLIQFSCS